MKKTKIVCSIGPASSGPEIFQKMVEAGMNVARVNFTHATEEECKTVINLVRETNACGCNHIAIMYDTKGPDFRTGIMENGSIELVAGNHIEIVKEDVLGTSERFTVNYKNVLDKLDVGEKILVEDGIFKFEVIEKNDNGIICRILNGGILGSKKGINVPGVDLGIEFLSEEDIADIKYACHNEGDFIALSFVSKKEDVLAVKELIEKENSRMKIVSKIESIGGLENIDDIIDVSDGIMVARGDLGVEVPLIDLPLIQKHLIKKCREKGKFCIVATEMLASMTKKPRPTRAEVSDVANAVLDGADAVMLSGETTIGDYPVETVKFMAQTCKHIEKNLDYTDQVVPLDQRSICKTIAQSAVSSANNLDAAAILVTTVSGSTSYRVSMLKPKPIILAICTSDEVARSMAFSFGVYPCIVETFRTTDEIVEIAKEKSRELLALKQGDLVVITGGFPQTKRTNFLKIEEL